MKALLPVALAFAAVSFAQELPNGPGKDTFQKACTACHGAELVTIMTDTKAGWTSTVEDMVSKGADMTDADKDKVITYLATAFPNPTNVNKATAKELETALEISSAEAEAVVAYRTKNGDFKTLNDLKKVPEVAAKVDAKKTRVVFK